MNQEEIKAVLPHRAPMLLVDRVLEKSESSIVCEKTFHAEEFFFQGHYPGFPIVPGVILCEVGAQSGAILLADHNDLGDNIPVLSRLNDVKFKRMVRPGETVIIRAEITEKVGRAFYLNATLTVGNETAARLTFACMPAPKTPPSP